MSTESVDCSSTHVSCARLLLLIPYADVIFSFFFFFFNDTATTEIYTLSLHDALPISSSRQGPRHCAPPRRGRRRRRDRKSTRLNSSHSQISYAVFCLKKKKKKQTKNVMQRTTEKRKYQMKTTMTD